MAFGRIGKALSKPFRKAGKQLKKNASTILTGGVSDVIEKTGEALTPDVNIDIPTPKEEPVMPIPDEELSRAARRRARARRKGGRSSSILTGGDTLGGY